MMKTNNRKGFTIVELVIVIAVIAILAGVLIPTFAGVTNKAKESKALQEVRTAYTVYVSETLANKGEPVEDLYVVYDGKIFVQITDGVAAIVKTEPKDVAKYELVDSTEDNSKTLQEVSE